MSHRDGNQFFVMEEPPGKCALCGAVEETRPYGPGGADICFKCGEANPEETKAQFLQQAFGGPTG